jgi:hypothetical protein
MPGETTDPEMDNAPDRVGVTPMYCTDFCSALMRSTRRCRATQPPLFGHKTLLNFDAWSYPDVGGWVLFISITLAVLIFLYEWRWPRKEIKNQTTNS